MIFNIILIIIITLQTWGIINITKKVEKYEDIIEENDKFIQDELARNEALLEALRQIDNRQMFEKDDDVGSIFNLIKETIERYKKR
jgi:membrane protein required for beta-lactamase induction